MKSVRSICCNSLRLTLPCVGVTIKLNAYLSRYRNESQLIPSFTLVWKKVDRFGIAITILLKNIWIIMSKLLPVFKFWSFSVTLLYKFLL